MTYKATDKWTFVGEANYFKDDGLRTAAGEKATVFGFDGYAAYVYSDELTFNFRGEIYRDNTGLVTTNYLSDIGFTNAIAGFAELSRTRRRRPLARSPWAFRSGPRHSTPRPTRSLSAPRYATIGRSTALAPSTI